MPIAAICILAIVSAGISVVSVGVITGFTGADLTIATSRRDAKISAIIDVEVVAVVASFIARLALGDILAADAITTVRQGTIIEAGIRSDVVAIVAAFAPGPHKAVAARCD